MHAKNDSNKSWPHLFSPAQILQVTFNGSQGLEGLVKSTHCIMIPGFIYIRVLISALCYAVPLTPLLHIGCFGKYWCSGSIQTIGIRISGPQALMYFLSSLSYSNLQPWSITQCTPLHPSVITSKMSHSFCFSIIWELWGIDEIVYVKIHGKQCFM